MILDTGCLMLVQESIGNSKSKTNSLPGVNIQHVDERNPLPSIKHPVSSIIPYQYTIDLPPNYSITLKLQSLIDVVNYQGPPMISLIRPPYFSIIFCLYSGDVCATFGNSALFS